MVYCFDIDGTICTNTEGDYDQAQPFHEMIEAIQELYATGHTIKLFTARGSTTGVDWRKLTEDQMAQWNVPYHELLLGKPYADLYVDDKGIGPEQWLKTLGPRKKADPS